MDKKITKLILLIAPLMILISAFSGCVGPGSIQTRGWNHLNTEGTAVTLWGFLTLTENFHNWDAYIVYDIESHDDINNYEYRVEADNYQAGNLFSANVENLDRATTYHYRAVGEYKGPNSGIFYGVDRTFVPGGPRVIVKNPSYIGTTSAVIEGELTHLGGASQCEVFFRYGEDKDFLNLETEHLIMTSTGDYNAELTGLSSCTTYYYRAVGINDADTWISSIWPDDIRAFTPGLPITETYLPNEVTQDSALFRGELFNMAGTDTCDVWFEYGDVNPNDLDETTTPETVSAIGPVNQYAEGLKTGTTYWVRIVADNGVCIGKGEIKEFRTLDPRGAKTITSHETRDFKSFFREQIERYLENNHGINQITLIELMDKYPIIARILK
jgi:hypothetical protein